MVLIVIKIQSRMESGEFILHQGFDFHRESTKLAITTDLHFWNVFFILATTIFLNQKVIQVGKIREIMIRTYMKLIIML